MTRARRLAVACLLAAWLQPGTAGDDVVPADRSPTTDLPRRTNALAAEASPYLRLQADQPVPWLAWSDAALERARRENRPIFLSIGYSTCHWCHVMARESFADAGIADLLDAHFVAIKVDREERPDLDERFMTRIELLTGSPGWPMNLILTPDGKVIAGATYLTRSDLAALLKRHAEAWQRKPGAMQRLADNFERRIAAVPTAPAASAAEAYSLALADIRRQYDRRHHGFGGAPKFPNHAALSALLDAYLREGKASDRRLFLDSLLAMVESPLRDNVDGGFFRYSVSEDWRRPHFEKMLYDQALLAQLLAEAWYLSGDARYAEAAEHTLRFVVGTLGTGQALYAGAMDAESEAREGAYYLWRQDELEARFTAAERTEIDAGYQRVEQRDAGFLLQPRADAMPNRALAEKLREARRQRPAPFVDAKAITAWNAMTIVALARSGALLDRPEFASAARTSMAGLLDRNMPDGNLHRYSLDGQAHGPAMPEDIAYLMLALAELYATDGDPAWLAPARRLAASLPTGDGMAGLARDSARDRHIPAPTAVLLEALDRLSRLTGEALFRQRSNELATAAAPLLGTGSGQASLARVLNQLKAPSPRRRADLADGHVRARFTRLRQAKDGVEFELRLEIDPGWHINSHQPLSPHLIATRLSGVGKALARVEYPEATVARPDFALEAMSLYQGTVRIVGLLVGADLAEAPPTIEIALQACGDKVCLKPETARLYGTGFVRP